MCFELKSNANIFVKNYEWAFLISGVFLSCLTLRQHHVTDFVNASQIKTSTFPQLLIRAAMYGLFLLYVEKVLFYNLFLRQRKKSKNNTFLNHSESYLNFPTIWK